MTLSPIIVRTSLGMGFTILTAATLGFLGLGAQPPSPEWGVTIAEARQFMPGAWWYATFPGLAIFVVVMGFNLIGDGLRDALDPRLRRHHVGGPDMAPHTPQRSERPGEAVPLLDRPLAAALEISDLTVHFRTARGRVEALERLHLWVGCGEIVGLVGESGCGKTVTARTILGILPPNARVECGQVRLMGEDVLRLSEAEQTARVRGKLVTLIPQDPLADLVKRHGISVLFITHDFGVVARLCDRVVVMYAGQDVEDADVRALFEHPRHPYTVRLLGSVPDPLRPTLTGIPGAVPSLLEPPPGCRFAPRCPHADVACTIRPPVTHIGATHTVRCTLYGETRQRP